MLAIIGGSGLTQLANLADKVRVWAQVTEARADPLLACLQALASQEPEAIAERVLRPALVTVAAPK